MPKISNYHVHADCLQIILRCSGDVMNIEVETKAPFNGIIHGPERSEPGCSALGHGELKTFLRIDLKKKESQGYCGIRYDPVTDDK